jgi:phenylpropionate dioxygenase-like ring-hydroxylating dioxygenase large terminal subunit
MRDELPRNCWYPLFLTRDFRATPKRVMRFGTNWVIYRDHGGQPRMAADRCPHLGASLAQGRVIDGLLQCPFHGFLFDGEGQCRLIPALGKVGRIPPKLCLTSVRLVESRGWIFGWWGEPQAEYPPLPEFSDIDDRFVFGDIQKQWPVHVTRAIENQLDVAHLPFVHRHTIGSANRPCVVGPYVESEDNEIRVWVRHHPDDGTPTEAMEKLHAENASRPPSLIFRFPGVWQLRIHDGLRLLVGFVPVSPSETLFMVRACHTFHLPGLSRLYSLLLGWMNRYILMEDLKIIRCIEPQSSMDASEDHPISADRAIVLFRRLWRKKLPPVSGGTE